MRLLIIVSMAALLSACNSSTSKKEPKQAMDDTARVNNPVTDTLPAVAIAPVKITAAQLPASVQFKGKLFEAWQWNDRSGENILVSSFEEPHADRNKKKVENEDEEMSAGLHASQYIKKDGSYLLLWQENDSVKDCGFDITCDFIKGSTTVTDLDKNGIAETTIQYRLACRSDVSPAEMKLILHEGATRYYLQGLCWIKASEEDKFTVTEKNANLETLPGYKKTDEEYMKTFGRYESEKGFAGASPSFLDYGRKQWMKFVIESFE